jgi:hypothetical protein
MITARFARKASNKKAPTISMCIYIVLLPELLPVDIFVINLASSAAGIIPFIPMTTVAIRLNITSLSVGFCNSTSFIITHKFFWLVYLQAKFTHFSDASLAYSLT